ncbi:MAG: hypothetical protein U9N31_04965 [Candidatus Marinimicrobia bacterium]|nr:hypothetical protein [Candidatus Neomarinimicrobiota bacterium]
MRAYLSGAMEFASDEGAGWRIDMTKWLDQTLNHSVYNPVEESQSLIKDYGAENYREWKNTDPKKYADFIRICVDRDIDTVRNHTDYIICLWDENVLKGAGTHAEVTLAYDSQKPVYLINKLPEADLSGWIMACSSKIFSDFEQLKNYLLEQYSAVTI